MAQAEQIALPLSFANERHGMRILLTIFGGLVLHGVVSAACPPAGVTRADLVKLEAAEGVIADDAKRQRLAIGLLDCLGDPDPFLRDEIAFSALEGWMRAQQLDLDTLQRLRTTQLASLARPDAAGFAQPFAALVLGEVVRADRLKPHLTAAERAELVQAGTTYLRTVRDYRGFDPKEGWRHAVAHAADFMAQLARHPAVGKRDQQLMLAAIGTQLSAASAQVPAQSFQFGEGERLAVPVFELSARSELETADWDAWFNTLAVTAAERVEMSPAQLAHRHNLKSFLMPLYIKLVESKDAAQRERMLPIVQRALIALKS